MQKLNIPQISVERVYNECLQGCRSDVFRSKFEECVELISVMSEDYAVKGEQGKLFTIGRVRKRGSVACGILNAEFNRLYSSYLSKNGKPGRRIYDEILVLSEEECPYCGGIGRPRTLDHYLPKAHYPQFAVLPLNLIPACRDCNMGEKGNKYPDAEEDQILHPYLDKEHFFTQQWVYAEIVQGNQCALRYHVVAPNEWSNIDKIRVQKHFDAFDLASRYSVAAGQELNMIINMRKDYMRCLSPEDFRGHLVGHFDAISGANNWKKIAYQALSRNEWFCTQQF